jgi:alkylation response protein AidB-like acyl-CoA dehydrogenase
MGYLLSQADISLHCPVTLTGAVAYILCYHATDARCADYLADLTRMNGGTKTGATWATEQHGGSDVGATTTAAKRSGDRFTLHGVKWFASNAKCGVAIATARPEGAEPGSSGLGLYLVPSQLEDGSPNHFLVRRLKDKFGTRGLPTGEIELLGADAIEIAPPPEGFKRMMDALEYSRVHNAVGAAGVQRRAFNEALAWCKERETFGRKLISYPMVQDELLRTRVQFEAGSLLAFEAALAFDEAIKDDTKRTWLRFTTALAKYLTAEYAIQSCRSALELFGGNGYTSDYPIARIYRDAQVLTVWEGPANIQALELMRLLSPRHHGAAAYEKRVRDLIERMPDTMAQLTRTLRSRLAEDLAMITLVQRDPESSARYARRLLHRLALSLGYALMCERAMEERGKELAVLAAQRYYEELDPPHIGAEDPRVREAALQLIDEEEATASRSTSVATSS